MLSVPGPPSSMWERHVTHAELQRHDKVHEPDHERHRHEENHDGAMRREDLIEMLRRQIALLTACRDCLLGAHHDRIRKTTEQHDQSKYDVHDTDSLVVDGCQPFAPQIRPISL